MSVFETLNNINVNEHIEQKSESYVRTILIQPKPYAPNGPSGTPFPTYISFSPILCGFPRYCRNNYRCP